MKAEKNSKQNKNKYSNSIGRPIPTEGGIYFPKTPESHPIFSIGFAVGGNFPINIKRSCEGKRNKE